MIRSKFYNRYSAFDYVLIWYSYLRLSYSFYDGIERGLLGGIALFGRLLLFWLIANWIVSDTKKTNMAL